MAQVRVRKRKQTWSYAFEAGKTEDGKRKVVEKGGFPTREDAYDAGTAAYTDWRHGNIGITSEAITVNAFFRNWLDNVVPLNVRSTTAGSYEVMYRNWIKPHFNGVMLQSLTPILLDQWLRNLVKEGLAKSSIRNAYIIMHQVLKYAVYPANLLQSNPSDFIKLPRSAPVGVRKRTIISAERFAELMSRHPFGNPLHIPLLLLYHTGMRQGEMVGLSWDDVDLEHKTISIVQQVVYRTLEKKWYFSPLKTAASQRRFIIDDVLVQELQAWKEQQQRNEAQYGDSYIHIYRNSGHDDQLIQMSKGLADLDQNKDWIRVPIICTWNNGKAVSVQYLAHHLRKVDLNAHSFRHTHATDLIENGATPKGVAGRLGHQNAVITQNLYTHNTEKLQRDTAAVFEKIMQTNAKCRQNADNDKK